MKRANLIVGWTLLGLGTALALARAEGPRAAGDGCATLGEWAGRGADTGVKFVDTVMGKWREVWGHPLVHGACTVSALPDGGYVLEGHIEAPPGEAIDAIRGVWTLEADGSVREELLRRARGSGAWEVFYSNTSRRTADRALVGGILD